MKIQKALQTVQIIKLAAKICYKKVNTFNDKINNYKTLIP